MKHQILSTIFIVALLLAGFSCGGGKKRQADGVAAQSATNGATNDVGLIVSLSDSLINHRKADTISFGRVREGERVIQEFMVRNAGDKALVITSIDLSCGCIEADYPKQPLKPGEGKMMTLTLDTRNLGGWIFKTAVMHTSLTTKPYVLYVTAEIE